MPKYPGVFKKGRYWYAYKIKNKDYHRPGRGFDTAIEAHAWRIKKSMELREGRSIERTNITVKEFIEEIYLEKIYYPKEEISFGTKRDVEGHLRTAIIPIVGSVKLQNLNSEICLELVNELRKKYSQNSASLFRHRFKSVLKKAVNLRYITFNPMDLIDSIPLKIEKPDVLTLEELYFIINNEKIWFRDRAMIALMNLCGLRIGECCGLAKEKIDFPKNTVLVDLQYTKRGELKLPKYGHIRKIPILPDLKPILETWYLQCGYEKWLFKGQSGNPIHQNGWRRGNWLKIRKKYNLQIEKPHALRHGFEQILLNNSIPDREVKQIMGHKDITMTGYYDRPYEERLVEVTRNIKVFDDIIARRKLE